LINLKNVLDNSAAKLGEGVKFQGLMSKKAHLKNGVGKSADDVLGWDNVFRTPEGVCYTNYTAQPPLIGTTQPQRITCPLGIRVFDSYEIDFKKAIEIINSMNCGDTFVAMTLSWPLTPECKEPYWHIRTTLGNDISIGANTGKSSCNKLQ
jgi:hypothetical protein